LAALQAVAVSLAGLPALHSHKIKVKTFLGRGLLQHLHRLLQRRRNPAHVKPLVLLLGVMLKGVAALHDALHPLGFHP